MNSNNRNENTFTDRLTSIVEANLRDENFGVSELAEKIRSEPFAALYQDKIADTKIRQPVYTGHQAE